MVDSSYILAPQIVRVSFELAPAFNGLESLRELLEVDRLSGFSQWTMQTAANLPPDRRELHTLIFDLCTPLFFEVMPAMIGDVTYLDYVNAVASRDPLTLRDDILSHLVDWSHHYPELWPNGDLTLNRLLNDEPAAIQYLQTACKYSKLDENLAPRAFALYSDPARLQATIVEHLHWMWNNVLADEWRRVEPMLRESLMAFERLNFTNMTAYEAARAVTTRDLHGIIDHKLENIEAVVFVPSAHIGPYVGTTKLDRTLYIVFGARLPRGTPIVSPDLSRAELLTRLNALGDDSRLRILELLTRTEELCAQDIIEQLGLSQSSASRHLSQLSASGFIVERRREAAKCYSLNTDRVMDTLRALTNFLARQ